MKKILILLFVTVIFAAKTDAQLCDVDTNNTQMISPPSEELPCIIRDSAYHAVMHFFCPPQIAGITIDSIRVTNFQDMPTGINYQCNPPGCKMYPWDRACLTIYGTTTDTVGEYKIKYSGFAYTSAGTASFNYLQNQGLLPEYFLTVIDSGALCKEEPQPSKIKDVATTSAIKVYPNPASSYVTIHTDVFKNGVEEIWLVNRWGAIEKKVILKNKAQQQFNLDVQSVPNGVYILALQSGTQKVATVISIQH